MTTEPPCCEMCGSVLAKDERENKPPRCAGCVVKAAGLDLSEARAERDGLATQVEILRSQVDELHAALDLATQEGRAAIARADEHSSRAQALNEQAMQCAREVVAAREREREALRQGEQAALVAASELRACHRLEYGVALALAELVRLEKGDPLALRQAATALRSALGAPEVDPGAPVELVDRAPNLAAASREAWILTVARLLWKRSATVQLPEGVRLADLRGIHRDLADDAADVLDLLDERLCTCNPLLRRAGKGAHYSTCPARALWLVTLTPVPFAVPAHEQAAQQSPDMANGRGRR